MAEFKARFPCIKTRHRGLCWSATKIDIGCEVWFLGDKVGICTNHVMMTMLAWHFAGTSLPAAVGGSHTVLHEQRSAKEKKAV